MSAVTVKARQAVATEAETRLDHPWRGLYRLSGVLLVVSGLGGFVDWRLASHLYPSGIPSTATAYLQLISHSQALANSLWSLWIIGDFVLIVPTVALYLVLRRDNQVLALLGTLVAGLYIVYDISVTELNSLTLVSLSNGYANATTAALQAPYVAAATYGYAALPLETVLSFGIGAVAYVFWSVVMLQGRTFPRWLAVSGIVVNVMGIIGAAAPVIPSIFILGLMQYFTVPLTGLWFIAIGVVLFRYSRKETLRSS